MTDDRCTYKCKTACQFFQIKNPPLKIFPPFLAADSDANSNTNQITNKLMKNPNGGPIPPPIPPRTNQSHHVTTTYITQDEVTISSSSTVSGNGGSGTGNETGNSPGGGGIQIAVVNDPKKKNEILKLRDMLLTDNSVESS